MSMKRTANRKMASDPSVPKYSISVAADLSGVPQQQLRRMEEENLVTPDRTEGNTRRYSDDDLEQIAVATDLAAKGINAAGIRYVLELRAAIQALQQENEVLRTQLAVPQNPPATRMRGRQARTSRSTT